MNYIRIDQTACRNVAALLVCVLLASCGSGAGGGSTGAPISATATTTAQNLTVGTAMTSFSPLAASGGATPYIFSYTGILPTGLSFSSSTGAVTGTPTAAYATTSLVFSVKDANNVVASTTSTVSFTVGAAVPISATANTTAQNLTVGTSMPSFSPLTASGGATPYVFSHAGALPIGLSFSSSTGAVTGTPTATYPTASLVFSVEDANNVAASTTSTVSFTVVAAGTITYNLNDTGITASQCYQAGSNVLVACNSAGASTLNNTQDGMAGRDANVATNSNADGKLGFSFTTVTGGCVQDNVTGLMWEVKTTDGGLRDWSQIYTNYDSTTALQKVIGSTYVYVAPTQAEIDAATNTVGFVTAVNASNLCGHNDWRLPTPDELQSIVDYGVPYPGPTIDTTWFPNTRGANFWSASPRVDASTNAWCVNFGYGFVSNSYRGSSSYVRLVRAGQ